jgi:hypothetical protein
MITFAQAKARAVNPQAFTVGHRFGVLNMSTAVPLESAPTWERAELAAQWCNEHETGYGRPAVYCAFEFAPARVEG